jgi:hypothetical protein
MGVSALSVEPRIRANGSKAAQDGGPKSPHGPRGNAARPVFERFVCPSNFLAFRVTHELPAEPAYFEFGANVRCYGRFQRESGRLESGSSLPNLLAECRASGPALELPFDPTEVIDNLRLERYPQGQLRAYENVLKKIYYEVRPLTNRGLRKRIQKFYAGDWKNIPFPSWPVDTTVEAICEKLLLQSMSAQRVAKVPFIWFWPRGADGCVVMTHDVETQAGRDFSLELADLDRSFDIHAAFQVIPEDRYEVPDSFLDSLRQRNCEIGVHDLNHDGKLYDDRKEFLKRIQRINNYGRQYKAKGFRSAVLYRNFEWYDRLDFSFDMSAPNVAHLDPQRGGCCTVFPYFIGNVLELPVTTTQDYTLFHLLEERSIDLWKQQTERILEKNGLVSFIVHPDYILEPDTRQVYEHLLGYLAHLKAQRQLWFALPGEVNSWWRARSEMSVVQDGNSWKVTGTGSERAVLAYAKNVNGKLEFEIPPQVPKRASSVRAGIH